MCGNIGSSLRELREFFGAQLARRRRRGIFENRFEMPEVASFLDLVLGVQVGTAQRHCPAPHRRMARIQAHHRPVRINRMPSR